MVKVLCPKCPNCGAPISTDSERCEYCASPVIITSFSSALESFSRAIDGGVMNSEVFFWAGVCCLGGKKAFLAKREVIDKAEEYLNATRVLDDRGIYAYFGAYVRYDYFKRKSLIARPDYRELLRESRRLRVSEGDIRILYGVLGVERPSEL